MNKAYCIPLSLHLEIRLLVSTQANETNIACKKTVRRFQSMRPSCYSKSITFFSSMQIIIINDNNLRIVKFKHIIAHKWS